MRPTILMIGCAATLACSLPIVTRGEPPASPKQSAPANAATLQQQVAAQAAEILRLKQQIADQSAEIEHLKQQLAGTSGTTTPTPSSPTSPTPSSPTSPGSSTAATTVYNFVLSKSYPEAVGAADNALGNTPDNIEIVALKAYALAAYGSIDGARPLVVKALKATDGKTGRVRALTLVAQGVVAVADGDTRAAAIAFQTAGNADSTLALAYIAYADLLHKVGKDELAHKLLQAAPQEKMTATEAVAVKQKLAAL